jgi:hypothetical protein
LVVEIGSTISLDGTFEFKAYNNFQSASYITLSNNEVSKLFQIETTFHESQGTVQMTLFDLQCTFWLINQQWHFEYKDQFLCTSHIEYQGNHRDHNLYIHTIPNSQIINVDVSTYFNKARKSLSKMILFDRIHTRIKHLHKSTICRQ